MRHFSAKTVRALARKGIALYGLQGSPDGETFYKVNDNGCGRVLSFRQVLEAAR
jgi:hypothetical protein